MSVFSSKNFLSESEIAAFKQTLSLTPHHPDTLVLQTLLATGARATEVLLLTKSSLLSQSIYVKGIKNSDDREVPISLALFEALKALPGEMLFPISYDTLRRIWLRYRPANKVLHSLRHTFAVTIYRRHKDILLVKTVLGHKSINSTMVYTKHLHSQDEVRQMLLEEA